MAAPSVPDVPKSGQPLQGQPPLTFFNINNADKSEEGGGADGDDDDADVPDREYTLEEIAACDGKGEDGTIYLAVCGKVFDVTAGSKFYGPGGPYENFAGRDATRGLGTFSLVPRKGKEHEPLTEKQIQNAARWIKLFKVKYKLIGRLKASPPPPPSAPATTKPASPPPTPKKQRSNSRTCRIL